MVHYLIEFRFFGDVKHEIKKLIWEIDQRFRLGHARHHRPIPHITLVGPFATRNEKRLIYDFKKLCSKQAIMTFKIKGFDTFRDTGVVFLYVDPDKNLDKFRWELYENLRDYCYLEQYDLERNFTFHATIAMNLGKDKIRDIKEYLEVKPEPAFRHYVARVTLIKGQRILREYDFFLRRILHRKEAKSRKILSETLRKLEQCLKENKLNNLNAEFSLPIEEIDAGKEEKMFSNKERLISKLLNKFKKRKIFFISDLHLDHTNIIRYCNRPFNSIEEMNRTLILNWNKTVGKSDIVYFLGDMAFGRGSRKTSYWLNKLNGNIIFVKGSHDRSRRINFYDRLILNYKHLRFLLVHNPKEVTSDWREWIIHGHVHNNDPEYPLINKNKKTINVSAELLSYKPILFEELLKSCF